MATIYKNIDYLSPITNFDDANLHDDLIHKQDFQY